MNIGGQNANTMGSSNNPSKLYINEIRTLRGGGHTGSMAEGSSSSSSSNTGVGINNNNNNDNKVIRGKHQKAPLSPKAIDLSVTSEADQTSDSFRLNSISNSVDSTLNDSEISSNNNSSIQSSKVAKSSIFSRLLGGQN